MNRFIKQIVLVAVGGLCFVGSAPAAIQYYDVDPSTANIDGGTANWEDSNWKANATDTSGTTWTDTNNAHFEAIVGSPSTTSITINSTPTAGQLVFNGPGYTIGGGSVTITDRIDAEQSATVNSDINFANNLYLFVAAGKILSLGGHSVDTNPGALFNYFNVVGISSTTPGVVALNGTGTDFSGSIINVGSFTAVPGTLAVNSGDVTFSFSGGLHQFHVGDGNGAGVVTWSSTGTLSNMTTLYLGTSGNAGTFSQTAGTVIAYNAAADFGNIRFDDSSSAGTYNLDGGTLEIHDTIQAASGGALNFGGGILQAIGTFSIPSSVTHGIASGATAHVDTNGFDMAIGGVISGASAAGLSKTGGGTLFLSGANTYAGLTDVQQGTLTLSGAAIGTVTGGVHVASGAIFDPGAAFTAGAGNTVSGGGTINNSVDASDAIVNPGDSPDPITIKGGLTLDAGSVLNFEFASDPAGGLYDQILLTTAGTRDLILDGTLNVINLGGLTLGQYTLISSATSITDDGLNAILPAGYSGTISTDANNVYLNITAIPEPASLGLMVLGGGMILVRRRHAKRA